MILKIFMITVWLQFIYASPHSVVQVDKAELLPFYGGYVYYPTLGYYKLYTTGTTWGKAWKQCKNDGSNLVVINSDEELKAVLELMKGITSSAFIGVHDLFYDQYFTTVTGEDLVPRSYNEWEDNGSQGYDAHCVKINEDGKLFVRKCYEEGHYICEAELEYMESALSAENSHSFSR